VFSQVVHGGSGWIDHSVDLAGNAVELYCETSLTDSALSPNAFWGGMVLLGQDDEVPDSNGEGTVKRKDAEFHPSVVLISLDTLAARQLGAFGSRDEVSPNIDSFLRSGFSFARAYAQYPITLTSHASLFTGLYPKNHGAYAGIESQANLKRLSQPTLAEMLSENGYLTAAFTEDAWVASGLGFDRGFDYYDDGPPVSGGQFMGHAKDTFHKALEWITRFRHSRFLIFVHTYEVHVPYLIRDKQAEETVKRLVPQYRGQLAKQLSIGSPELLLAHNRGRQPLEKAAIRDLRALYAGEVNYLDRAFGDFMAKLDSATARSRPVVILMSDHGEEFDEHGRMGHGATINNQAVHVPLAFRWSGRIKSGLEDSPVQLVDVMPTILDLAGIDPSGPVDGRSLKPIMEGRAAGQPRPAFTELRSSVFECERLTKPAGCRLERFAVQTDRFKLMTSGIPPAKVLYDLANDPKELVDVSEMFPGELEKHRKILESYRREERPGKRNMRDEEQTTDTDGVGEEVRQQLKALGYVD
jgi:arylsulfatase A-like enzyme